MPWCPHCDEMFPEGPACPRCQTPLVDVSESPTAEDAQVGGNLPQLKVPRRIRRAFNRMNRPPTPPRHLMGFTVFLLVFAGGLLLGRLGSVPSDAPALRLSSNPLATSVDGSLSYVTQGDLMLSRELMIVRHELRSGRIEPVTPFSVPYTSSGRDRTRLRSMDGSVALTLTEGGSASFVGAFPAERSPLLWLDGVEAAWADRDTLLVLEHERAVAGWTFDAGVHRTEIPGPWIDVRQVPGGAVLEGVRGTDRSIALVRGQEITETLAIPNGASVLAVSPAATRALVDTSGDLALWDGSELVPLKHVEGYQAVAGSFSPEGDRIAITLVSEKGGSSLSLGVSDLDGGTALRRLTTHAGGRSCDPVPVWEASGSWVYVAPGDAKVYAAEVGGGRLDVADAGTIGCGLAWAG